MLAKKKKRRSRRRTSGEDEEDDKEGDDKLVMAWDTPKVMLPEGPRERWTRASRAEVKLPLASKVRVHKTTNKVNYVIQKLGSWQGRCTADANTSVSQRAPRDRGGGGEQRRGDQPLRKG